MLWFNSQVALWQTACLAERLQGDSDSALPTRLNFWLDHEQDRSSEGDGNEYVGDERRWLCLTSHCIIAFLEAMTDTDFDGTIPARVPSGLPPGGNIDPF